MGVYARKHAQQMILDAAPIGGKSSLTPRAQLLLLHIAQHFAGDENEIRNVRAGKLWDRDATYYEGLGKKARAIGYNVPPKIDALTVEEEIMTPTEVRAVKAAVQKAVNELLEANLLTQTKVGRTGQNATYALTFLGRTCSICRHEKDGQRYMDATLHLPNEVREGALERADDWSHSITPRKSQDAWGNTGSSKPPWEPSSWTS